jgi:hypothetical protein
MLSKFSKGNRHANEVWENQAQTSKSIPKQDVCNSPASRVTDMYEMFSIRELYEDCPLFLLRMGDIDSLCTKILNSQKESRCSS